MPKALLGEHGSDLAQNKRYDQILCLPSEGRHFAGLGGTVDFYAGGIAKLFPGEWLGKREFTYEMRDHLPLWVQVRTG